jgi:hypothetical protein
MKISNPLMARKLGNHLFCNPKAVASEQPRISTSVHSETFGEMEEQIIILGREDIRADIPPAPLLDWSRFEKGVAVQLKDTEGLSLGSVTIKASTLQRIHPALLPGPLESEYFFPVALKTVVLQVQAHLRQSSEECPTPIGPDFDTPIAQVAREDEGFFKITEAKETPIDETPQAQRRIPEPVLTPADRPASPLNRRKPPVAYGDSAAFLRSSATVPAWRQLVSPNTELRRPERGAVENPLNRLGLERLREIFMTEDQLDAGQVARHLAAFPKVRSAMVMLGDGTVLGGDLPEGYDLETALLTPVIMRNVRELNRRLRLDETSAFTLLGERLVTLFSEGNVHVLISHEGRGLLPGMRKRIGEVARALDALCRGLTKSDFPERHSDMLSTSHRGE